MPSEIKYSLNHVKKSSSRVLVFFENLIKKNNILVFVPVLVRWFLVLGTFSLLNIESLKELFFFKCGSYLLIFITLEILKTTIYKHTFH